MSSGTEGLSGSLWRDRYKFLLAVISIVWYGRSNLIIGHFRQKQVRLRFLRREICY